ncbi:uncharacterized protein LOC141588558 [Silene latifolia]|uniref:uncharacterized protein LOC141588558 n=1 Tax=Silene latifolia TaxID=37657 RepID=UPI003D7782F2
MSPTHNVQGLGSDDRYVSLLTNNIGVEVGDGNIQGDEVEDDVDLRLENASDEDDEDEEDIDHVSSTAPNPEFTSISKFDEIQGNNWANWKNVVPYDVRGEFSVGQTFPNKRYLTEAITSYNLRVNQSFKIHESKPHTVTYKCGRRPTSCSWTLRALQKKLVSDAFTIVRYNGGHERSCVGDTMPIDHRNLRRTFISNAIRNIVEADWGLMVNAIIEIIIDKYNYKISYMKAWKAKQKALADIFGDWELSYQLLPRFFEDLKEANPGTVVQFVNYPTDDPNVVIFGWVFWAFGASIKGFPHCRPIITIDGTHLYGKYKGVLMISMGVDANDQLYPLAFAIVELETTETWSWFLACIRCLVTQRSGLCIISDRHPGIMKAMNENGSGWEEPFAYHRFCIRHHASNINSKFKNKALKDLFSWTAFQHQSIKFNTSLAKINELNVQARADLDKLPLSKWSMCHGGALRYGIKTTNLAEVFNNVLKGARFLPVTALVKVTFFRV